MGQSVMTTDKVEGLSFAGSESYEFPADLIAPEDEGPAFTAFRAVAKINSANHFNEEVEGRQAMERVAESFFNVAHQALTTMKPESSGE